jgi:HSP20 family protein
MAEQQSRSERNDGRNRGSLEAWTPFRELMGAAPRWPRALDEWLGERMPIPFEGSAPSLDVTETDDAYLIHAEVPGVKKQDLNVEFRDGVLTLRGEKKAQRDREDERGRILERSYGVFTRSLRLPEDADADQVSASLQDGVLRLEIRKLPESKPKVISIKG